MGNGMSEVLKGLYIGNIDDSQDETQLTAHGITHIISIYDNAKPVRTDKEYLCFNADDVPGSNIRQFFAESNRFIHVCRLGGGNVLIHCRAGVSRSVTLMVAYMMTVTGYSWQDCLRVVRTSRSVAEPNGGFQKQLRDYENSAHLAELKEDLSLRYPNYSPDEDIKKMQELLQRYHQDNNEPKERFIYSDHQMEHDEEY